jgi:hypothetical protein
VANGTRLSCVTQFKQTCWELQGLQFCSDLKVIQLGHFYMVLGYDWLAQFSPMQIHWGAKWLAVHSDGRTVVIQGLMSKLHDGDVVQLFQLDETDLHLDIDDGHKPDQQLLPEIKAFFSNMQIFLLPRFPFLHQVLAVMRFLWWLVLLLLQ